MLQIKGAQFQQCKNTKNSLKKLKNNNIQVMNKPPLPKSKIKKVKILKHDYLCDQRKQNILNGRYLRKKQKLLEITKQNVRLFQKINTQKSIYSHESLNKSYQSNKSLIKSRMSQTSINSLKGSRSLNRSKRQIKDKDNENKNSFFHRASSAKKINQNGMNKILIRNINQKKSQANIMPIKINDTRPEQIKKFTCLFNITQEPSLKQKNRPNRIRSSIQLRNRTSFHNVNKNQFTNTERMLTNNKIVINQQNQIQIHQQIKEQIQIIPSSRAKANSQVKKSILRDHQTNIIVQKNKQPKKMGSLKCLQKVNQQFGNLLTLDNKNQRLLAQQRSFKYLGFSNQSEKQNGQINQNLKQIRNHQIKARLSNKLKNKDVAEKYSKLLNKINQELNKVKRPKQSTIFQYKSRLIA